MVISGNADSQSWLLPSGELQSFVSAWAHSQASPEEHCHLCHVFWVPSGLRSLFWMSFSQEGVFARNPELLCQVALQMLDLKKAASSLWSWLITCEAASRTIVLLPWIINKPFCPAWVGRGKSDNSIIFLSFVWAALLFSLQLLKWLVMMRRKEKNVFPFNACGFFFVFSPKLESGPLPSHHLGSHSTKGSRLAMGGKCYCGSAPNICSKLQTGPDLETRQLVQQMANSPAPLGLETRTIFFLQPKQPRSCSAWVQKAFLVF